MGSRYSQAITWTNNEIFDKKWYIKHAGLFTFAQSAKHIGLYQKFGFWPRFLTIIMSKPVWPAEEEQEQRYSRNSSNGSSSSFRWSRFSEIAHHKQEQTLDRRRLLTIVSVNNQNLGDTILLYSNNYNDNNITNKDDDNTCRSCCMSLWSWF